MTATAACLALAALACVLARAAALPAPSQPQPLAETDAETALPSNAADLARNATTASPPGTAGNSTGHWLVRGAMTDRVPAKGPKIVGGEKAEAAQFPYIVSIRKQERTHFCGGSIVSKTFVLTAAHCFDDKPGQYNTLVVTAGSLSWMPGAVDSTGYTRDVKDGLCHEKWVPGANKKWYDIAMLEVAEPFGEWTDYVKSILINTVETLPVGSDCRVSGWGKTADEENVKASEILLWTTVQLQELDACSSKYGEAMGPGSICAGYEPGGKDSCQGDSGGPLECDGRLAGIVSFGHGCAVKGFPGVYTATSGHLDWIREHTDAQSGQPAAAPVLAQTLVMLILAGAASL